MNDKNEVLTYDDYVKGVEKLTSEQQRHLIELLSIHLKNIPENKRKNIKLQSLVA